MFIPEIETKSSSETKLFQEQILKKHLEYLQSRSPFYRAKFNDEKIDIQKIKKLEDLVNITPTDKDSLQKNYRSFLCVDESEIVDYLTTSGTSGEPVVFGLTENDLQRLEYNEYLSLMTAGITKQSTVQLMTTLDRRFIAGFAYYLGLRKIGASIIRVGAGTPEFQWDTIHRLNPDTIIVVPSFILKLIDFAERNNIDYLSSSIRKAVCIGDSLREEDFALNSLGRRIREKWDIGLYSTYASTEMATAFTECEYGVGGHFHPELIIVELLDECGNPVCEGEAGEVTVTTLGVEGMPLLRFKTGDICSIHSEPCKCGRNTFRLGPVIGRKNQMLKVMGTTIYPPALYNILDSVEGVVNYIVTVSRNELGLDEIKILIGTKYESSELTESIAEHFRAKLRLVPVIEFMKIEEINKLQLPALSRKAMKFIDWRTSS